MKKEKGRSKRAVLCLLKQMYSREKIRNKYKEEEEVKERCCGY